MDHEQNLPRNVVLYSVVVLVAALIGIVIAAPGGLSSVVAFLVFCTLISPLVIRWHHFFLLLSWNAAISLAFLPGSPPLWILMSGASLGIAIVTRLVTHKSTFINVPSVSWSLIFMAVVVLITAYARGGIGFQALGGGTSGGKRYVYILAAVIGFFALASHHVPANRARFCAGAYVLPGLTAMISNVVYLAGPAFYFLYWVFPAGLASSQAFADYTGGADVKRFAGFATAGSALLSFMLLRFGIRGILEVTKPWRLLAAGLVLVTTLLGGFRSSLIMFVVLCGFQFYFERLYRTRLVVVMAVAAVMFMALLPFTARSMPLSIQRSVSFLPIDVDPLARYSASATTEWRLRMWNLLLPDIPKYLLLGKGYALDMTDMYLLAHGLKLGFYEDVDLPIMIGNYHNGPLTLLIPFGLGGMIAFTWFGIATLRLLYRNYVHAPPHLRAVNTFLLSYFLMRLVYFVLVWGQVVEDFFEFTGVAGLSIALNGGMLGPQKETASRVIPEQRTEVGAVAVA
jgi:hypothetical protein